MQPDHFAFTPEQPEVKRRKVSTGGRRSYYDDEDDSPVHKSKRSTAKVSSFRLLHTIAAILSPDGLSMYSQHAMKVLRDLSSRLGVSKLFGVQSGVIH